LREHQLEAFLQLQVARVLERRQRLGLVEVLVAADAAAPPGLAGFAHERPAAEQVALEHELDVARGFAAVGALLEQEAHGRLL
jgi:hypothetical protein